MGDAIRQTIGADPTKRQTKITFQVGDMTISRQLKADERELRGEEFGRAGPHQRHNVVPVPDEAANHGLAGITGASRHQDFHPSLHLTTLAK